MSYKGFSLWLMVSLIVGAGLGAYGVVEWKEREVASRVTDAVLLEQERQSELYEERDVLRQKLEFQRLQLELSGIAVDTRRNNFGLAQERLARFGEDLEKMSREVGSARVGGDRGDLESTAGDRDGPGGVGSSSRGEAASALRCAARRPGGLKVDVQASP